jgi:DNA-directed RNA polymerase subunit M/transcription elongation factor TFIIS
MYYLKISEENVDNIMYFCRKCGDNDTNIINNKESFCISKTHIKKTTEIYKNVINEFTKLDPTLPRIKNISCPNDNCVTNGSEVVEKPEIIYIRYDNNNMKYIYLCSECDYTWKNT